MPSTQARKPTEKQPTNPGRFIPEANPGRPTHGANPGRHTHGANPGRPTSGANPGRPTRGANLGRPTRGANPDRSTPGAIQVGLHLENSRETGVRIFCYHYLIVDAKLKNL